jgi:iron-sulfur cluster assembly accessory protein
MSTATAHAMDYSSTIGDDQISITPGAQAKIAELLAGADDDIEAVRIFVSGGGCSGMTYGMTYTDSRTEYDSVLEGDGFRIVVDAVALNYLQGCEIDFVTRGVNQTFVFNNVFQAVGGSGTCGGCGGGGF